MQESRQRRACICSTGLNCKFALQHVLTTLYCGVQAAPIVRVAVEAALPSELPRLVEGLRLLNRADPFLEVTLQDKGEYVLGAAGTVSVHAYMSSD